MEAGQRGLLLRFLEAGEPPDRERALDDGLGQRRPGGAALEGPAHHRRQRLGLVAELVVERQVLGAGGIGHRAVQRRLVLLEEVLGGAHELLGDRLVVVVGQHRHWTEQAERAPRDRQRGAHDLGAVLLGHEAAPRLHEPAVVDVLGAVERLARTRPQLALEEVAEALLEDVLDLREVALADATDLDLRQPSLRVEAGAIDGGPHEAPARSSSSVMTPEWSRPPRPFTRSALNSSCTTAVVGSGTPSARADSMMRPRSL